MTVTANQLQGTATGLTERSNAMSLTYSDFLYTRNDYSSMEDIGDVGVVMERRRLPSEFKPIQETKVPLMQNDDPINHDFIIIAEFSELEGPIPLCTIPNNATELTDIQLNDFVVHLMSTDYQVNSVGQFRICQDTQVMRKNVFPNVHVFMQYLTLYDLKARGFVRPFCFGFVTKDHIKLDKYIKFLVSEFGKVTSVLEYCNREWFSYELRLYLEKLRVAKESYIQEHKDSEADSSKNGNDDSESDEYLDSDTVTLTQIAHQYSEIQNILTVVESFESRNLGYIQNIMTEMKCYFERNPNSSLAVFLKQINIKLEYQETGSKLAESLIIPLVHPLRSKGEPLRSLTTMGQMGSIYLIGKLMQLYTSCKMDLICTEMTEATLSFREHFKNLKLNKNDASTSTTTHSPTHSSSGISSTDSDGIYDHSIASCSSIHNSRDDRRYHKQSISEMSPFEIIQDHSDINNIQTLLLNLNKNELQQIVEKLHMPTSIISDSKSGSYHTVSEEDSDLNLPSTSQPEAEGTQEKDDSPSIPTYGTNSHSRNNGPKVNSMNSFSSDDDMSLSSSPTKTAYETSEEIILKEPWWIYVSQKLVRSVPGYGLAYFFRRYHAIAHHIVYSILLGRPIIICGEEKLSRRIGRIITSLIPLVPVFGGPGFTSLPEVNRKSWRLLRWHRGIVVQSHIESYRLIGLCIPEKLEVYDLIPPRLVTLVTIISAEKKTILGGPAYSGDLLQNFEKKMLEHFYNSDVSILAYIGSLYAEIEGKVYMYKCLEEKYKGASKTFSANAGIYSLSRELNLRASDVEIVKHLSSLITDPSECVNIL